MLLSICCFSYTFCSTFGNHHHRVRAHSVSLMSMRCDLLALLIALKPRSEQCSLRSPSLVIVDSVGRITAQRLQILKYSVISDFWCQVG